MMPAPLSAAVGTRALREHWASGSLPAYNSLGKPLQESLQPYAPRSQHLVVIRIDIDGSDLSPPVDRSYRDELLWNIHDDSLTPQAFASMTCEEENLPKAFEGAIAATITREAAREAARERHEAGHAAQTVSIDLHAERRGFALHDRFLWEVGPAAEATLTAESFARRVCADLGLPPDMSVAVAASLRQEVQRMGDALPAGSVGTDGDGAVRSEKEAIEWSPVVSADNRPGDTHELFKSADRRDRYRKRQKT